jgi:hypothetical protein
MRDAAADPDAPVLEQPDPDEPRERLELSLAQVAASSLAAVSAAVLCSYFGVAGTVIGTAAASVVATIGSALYGYSLRRTRARLRRLHQAGAASPPFSAVLSTAKAQGIGLFTKLPWRIVLLGTANVFVFSIALVTGIEGIVGEPLSTAYGGNHSHRSCSLCHRESHPKSPSPSPSVSPSRSPSPSPSVSPSQTVSPSPSVTSTIPGSPSVTPTPSLSTTPSLTPTVTPSRSTG